jgi:hypothetical protein
VWDPLIHHTECKSFVCYMIYKHFLQVNCFSFHRAIQQADSILVSTNLYFLFGLWFWHIFKIYFSHLILQIFSPLLPSIHFIASDFTRRLMIYFELIFVFLVKYKEFPGGNTHVLQYNLWMSTSPQIVFLYIFIIITFLNKIKKNNDKFGIR